MTQELQIKQNNKIFAVNDRLVKLEDIGKLGSYFHVVENMQI